MNRRTERQEVTITFDHITFAHPCPTPKWKRIRHVTYATGLNVRWSCSWRFPSADSFNPPPLQATTSSWWPCTNWATLWVWSTPTTRWPSWLPFTSGWRRRTSSCLRTTGGAFSRSMVSTTGIASHWPLNLSISCISPKSHPDMNIILVIFSGLLGRWTPYDARGHQHGAPGCFHPPEKVHMSCPLWPVLKIEENG